MKRLTNALPELSELIKGTVNVKTYLYYDGDLLAQYKTAEGVLLLGMYADVADDRLHWRDIYFEFTAELFAEFEAATTPYLQILRKASHAYVSDDIKIDDAWTHEVAKFTVGELFEQFAECFNPDEDHIFTI